MDRGWNKYGMGSYNEFVATSICPTAGPGWVFGSFESCTSLFIFSILKKINKMEKFSIHKIKIFLAEAKPQKLYHGL